MRTATACFAGVGTVVIAVAAGLGSGLVIADMVSPHQAKDADRGVQMSELDRRISEAISATASLIIGAWEAAGRPAVPIEERRPVEKVVR